MLTQYYSQSSFQMCLLPEGHDKEVTCKLWAEFEGLSKDSISLQWQQATVHVMVDCGVDMRLIYTVV